MEFPRGNMDCLVRCTSTLAAMADELRRDEGDGTQMERVAAERVAAVRTVVLRTVDEDQRAELSELLPVSGDPAATVRVDLPALLGWLRGALHTSVPARMAELLAQLGTAEGDEDDEDEAPIAPRSIAGYL